MVFQTVNRWLVALFALGLFAFGGGRAAIAVQSTVSSPDQQAFHIQAQSDFYQLAWNGTSGTLTQIEPSSGKRTVYLLTLLRIDSGPVGYAHYLVWFLARSPQSFAILWCYLNDTGNDFYCWLYRYPGTQLNGVHFRGDYSIPPQVPIPTPLSMPTLQLPAPPIYTGPSFTYRNWTTQGGTIPRLPLWTADHSSFAQPVAQTDQKPERVLTDLQVTPLHQVNVTPNNGWRSDGWGELHALAYDSAKNPYYLILYSNTAHGYVIDLKEGRIYVADFGTPVVFAPGTTLFGVAQNDFSPPPSPRVPAYSLQEITLYASGHYTNPYTQVRFEVEFSRPDGQVVTVPGFWDGGQTWRVRIAPTLIGDWQWKTLSNDPGLNGQVGRFTCITEAREIDGFLIVDPENPREFRYAGGSHFLPVPVWLSLTSGAPTAPAPNAAPKAATTASLSPKPASSSDDPPQTNADVLTTLQKLHDLGVNRLMGTWILDAGSQALVNDNPDSINPTFFQMLDAKVRACNLLGIVPDIGLSRADSPLLKTMSAEQLQRFWSYVVARYSAYNVCWNLLDASSGFSSDVQALLQNLIELTHKVDIEQHPITAILPGITSLPSAPQFLGMPSDESTSEGAIFISSPAGMPLWPTNTNADEQELAMERLVAAQTPSAQVHDLDIITIKGGNLLSVAADQTYRKPIVICDPVSSTDEARRRLWETRLSGGYWVAEGAPIFEGTQISPIIAQSLASAHLFNMISYWLLRPHDDLLSAPDGGQLLPDIHALANPGWFYVVYFPTGGSVQLDLLEATGQLEAAWFNPRTDSIANTFRFSGGQKRVFRTPDSQDWVLLIRYPN
ncbi:Protein of unknown function (DUF4038) [Chthonomonas calidirosea]|uniref:DUF5060 domain-containing protein n=1 Tax=Chthonomonas calidirosea TaxID=454171 RepID=UPI0006DD53E3|nr:DUF5060 domain-containing protein [Chthonomonas calidirosea]CEK19318.1 Protein of unknown function (DUF4038) [Chthonomonas calidirosea]